MGCNSSKPFKSKRSTTASTTIPQSPLSATSTEKRPYSDEQPFRAAPAPAPVPAPAPILIPVPPVKRTEERKPVAPAKTSATHGVAYTDVTSHSVPASAPPATTFSGAGVVGAYAGGGVDCGSGGGDGGGHGGHGGHGGGDGGGHGGGDGGGAGGFSGGGGGFSGGGGCF